MKLTRRQALGGMVATIAGTSFASYLGSDDIVAQSMPGEALNLRVTDIKVFMVAPRSTFVKVYTNRIGRPRSVDSVGKKKRLPRRSCSWGAVRREESHGHRSKWEDFYSGVVGARRPLDGGNQRD